MAAKKTTTAKTKKAGPTNATEEKPTDAKKLSALDAAAQVLVRAKDPKTCRELIEAMEAKKLWTSPGGKTPHATLYSALVREINLRGDESRFVKVERGKFAANK